MKCLEKVKVAGDEVDIADAEAEENRLEVVLSSWRVFRTVWRGHIRLWLRCGTTA